MSQQEALTIYAKLIRHMIAISGLIFYLSTGQKAPSIKEVLRML